MLTAEIRVNGILIGHIYCVNQGGTSTGWCEYAYRYYRPDQDIIEGTVKHFRPNGAAALLKEVFEDIESKGGK